jgi:hypothetical protein
MSDLREFLSNHRAGPWPRFLYHFRQQDLYGRRQAAGREEQYPHPRLRPLTICQLHDCDSNLLTDPRGTLPAAHFGLELAQKTKDPDLISWAQSGIGAIEILLTHHAEAGRRLEIARRIAVAPYQKADACRLHAGLARVLAKNEPKGIRSALRAMTHALTISANAPVLINSDRGHTAILLDKAVCHLSLGEALNDDSSQYDMATDLLQEILDTACPLHARRARRLALINLVLHHLKMDRTPPRSVVERLKAYPVTKSSFLGAVIQWVLIFNEIREDGYKRCYRRRLITVRKHLKDREAFDYAATLTMAIAALDASRETSETSNALTFLRGVESRDILTRATVADPVHEEHYMSPVEIIGMAQEAGAGNVSSMAR